MTSASGRADPPVAADKPHLPTAHESVVCSADGDPCPCQDLLIEEVTRLRADLTRQAATIKELRSAQPDCCQGFVEVETGVQDPNSGVKEFAREPCGHYDEQQAARPVLIPAWLVELAASSDALLLSLPEANQPSWFRDFNAKRQAQAESDQD